MQKIIPHLWYDKEAKEAAAFYTSVFPESKVIHTGLLRNTPSGDCDIVRFELWGQQFMAISAGPYFKFNPSISFMVHFDARTFGDAQDSEQAAREKLDEVWNKLKEEGNVLMDIGEYPFSKRYGWIADKYGLSWQLMLTDTTADPRPSIMPSMLFVGDNCGKAEEAMEFYLSIFKDAKPGAMHRYVAGMEPDKEGSVMYEDFMLERRWFAAMDSAHKHQFEFNEAVSFLVNCADQAEINHYWQKLSAVPEAEQCGWLKDKYGMSWQISSAEMQEIMEKGTQEQVDRIAQAFLKMKKLEIATLKKAY